MDLARSILVEGWRGVAHSYAIVNEYQCRELLRRSQVRLYFRDAPLPSWLTSASASDLSIPPPPDDVRMDAILRIGAPMNLAPAPTNGLFVFGTCEMGFLPPQFVSAGPLADAQARSPNLTIITPSNWSRDGFIRSGGDPARVVVVPHGVDVNSFHPPSSDQRSRLRAALGFDGFVFLHISSMTRNKGIVRLLKGFAPIASRHSHVRLALKGLDEIYDSHTLLRDVLNELSASERAAIEPGLIYNGRTMNAAELIEWYQAADAYVSPYLAEGFNLPVMEAAACGLPVICTAGGSTDDFVTDDFALRIRSTIREGAPTPQARCLVPDMESLLAQMQTVIDRPDWREKAAAQGPRFMSDRFTWAHVVDQLLRVMFEKGSE